MAALCEEHTHGELEDRVYYMPSFFPCGKAGGRKEGVAKGLQQNDYGGTLGALALKPSGFCNIGVKIGILYYDRILRTCTIGPNG